MGSALAGTDPTVLRRMRAGFAVIGDRQHLPAATACSSPTVRTPISCTTCSWPTSSSSSATWPRWVGRSPRSALAEILDSAGSTWRFKATTTPSCTLTSPRDTIGSRLKSSAGPLAALHHWVGRSDAASALGRQHDDLRAELVAELAIQLDASPDSAAALAAPSRPFRAVIFDFHQTLSHLGAPRDWLDEAW
ncbi:MAG: hypothetical protein ACR2FV_14455, partial [Ornithinimicrobium sp.]|uniref:hypothetical protein n=1 Tax=Ornithinimicrobium sp. TaxID=1977084 RepID=UPI003D9BD9D1